MSSTTSTETPPTNFIKQIIEYDLSTGKHSSITTRFPPEPNGFLHIGHAKAIHLNYGLAREFGGRFNLRFDDTNPGREEVRYIEGIKEDLRWLGCNFGDNVYYTSDYFPQLYDWAVILIKKGLAYVDDQTITQIREARGSLTQPGTNSPHRGRTVDENLRLFQGMKDGVFEEGQCVLRAKIDMTSGNMNLRDPILYRILKTPHPRTGSQWNIYPTYDFAHGQSDSIENITHSLCSLEFEIHRPLYEWLQEHIDIHKTRQIEFARLNLTYTLLSKRKLLTLVQEGYVDDWDDPRMPTIAGYRRRGFPPEAIRNFCNAIGVAKRATTLPIERLENCAREFLDTHALRRFCVLKPLKVNIINFSNDVEEIIAPNHPLNPNMGDRKIYFSKTIYIDEDDFMEKPTKGFIRLSPGKEVRLRFAYVIKCEEVIKDETGRIIELNCTYDPETSGGKSKNKKVQGTLHWVDSKYSTPVEVRYISRLFTKPFPDEKLEESGDPEEEDETLGWKEFINKDSMKVYQARGETSLEELRTSQNVQFERVGFFVKDKDSTPKRTVYTLTVDLNSSFEKEADNDKNAHQKARENKAAERKARDEKRALKAAMKEMKITPQ